MLELDKKTRLNLEQARVLLLEDPQPGAEILSQTISSKVSSSRRIIASSGDTQRTGWRTP